MSPLSAISPSHVPVVTVIVPHWNTPAALERCAAALDRGCGDVSYELIVVDNGSCARLRPRIALERNRRILFNAANRGFAAACNQAAHCASGRYLLFLNSDVTVAERSIETLVTALDREAEIAGVAPLEHDTGGRVSSPARRWLDPVAQGCALLGYSRARRPISVAPARVERVPWVTAAALLVRARAFRLIGGFDERFYFYEEDEDLGWRFARRGYRVAVCAVASVVHNGGLSVRAAGAWPALSLYAGQVRFVNRRYGAPGAWAYRVFTSFAISVKGAAGVVLRGRRNASELARPAPFRVLKLIWSRRMQVHTAEG